MNRFRSSIPNGFRTVANGPYPNQYGLEPAILSAALVDGDAIDVSLGAREWFNIVCFEGIATASFDITARQAAWTVECVEADRLTASVQAAVFTPACYDSTWDVESPAVGRFEVTLLNSLC